MITATITIGADSTTIEISGTTPDGEDGERRRHVVPRGATSLHRRHITADPPLPQNLTNAIGDMTDHLDDAVRDLPELVLADRIVVAGDIALAMAAVEIGSTQRDGEFVLTRDAAEDVFRTLATEPLAQRRHNPGLPADLVETSPAGCCAVVAVLRSLQLDEVVVAVPDPAVVADHVGTPSSEQITGRG